MRTRYGSCADGPHRTYSRRRAGREVHILPLVRVDLRARARSEGQATQQRSPAVQSFSPCNRGNSTHHFYTVLDRAISRASNNKTVDMNEKHSVFNGYVTKFDHGSLIVVDPTKVSDVRTETDGRITYAYTYDAEPDCVEVLRHYAGRKDFADEVARALAERATAGWKDELGLS